MRLGPDSSVGIAIRYGLLDGPGIESWWGIDFPHQHYIEVSAECLFRFFHDFHHSKVFFVSILYSIRDSIVCLMFCVGK
jgi:hypothetical protein